MNMKLAAAVTLVMGSVLLAGCEKKPETMMESASEAVGDATDTREHEGMKDAVEDMQEAASDAGEAVSDAAADAKDAAKEAMDGDH